jgi:putative lipoprotein
MKIAATMFALACTILAFAFSADAQAQTPATSSQSTGATATVTGTALYRERLALPQTTIFEAVLEDTSLVDAPAVRIGSCKKDHPGNPPFHFSIAYDPAKIVESHTYLVRATITLDGKLMFTSTSSHPVITKGNPTTVSIGMQHVAPDNSSPSVMSRTGVAPEGLENTYWKLTVLGSKTVTVGAGKREPSLILHPEGMRTEVFGGCNSFAGTYTVKGKELHFSAMAGTLMACDDNSMDIEKNFAGALTETRTFHVVGKHLDLMDEQGKAVARFESRVMQ